MVSRHEIGTPLVGAFSVIRDYGPSDGHSFQALLVTQFLDHG